jgi:hypothetical protein
MGFKCMYDLYTQGGLSSPLNTPMRNPVNKDLFRPKSSDLKAYRFFRGAFGSYVTAASNSESASFRL